MTEDAFREYESRRIPRAVVVAQKSQMEAMQSYDATAGKAAKLEVAALPAYPRVVNFDKDMEYDDWLHDIQWPNLTNTPQVL